MVVIYGDKQWLNRASEIVPPTWNHRREPAGVPESSVHSILEGGLSDQEPGLGRPPASGDFFSAEPARRLRQMRMWRDETGKRGILGGKHLRNAGSGGLSFHHWNSVFF